MNDELFLVLHNLLSYEWVAELVRFFTHPLGSLEFGIFDLLVIGSVLLVIFLYVDGKPGFAKISRVTLQKAVVIGFSGVAAWFASDILKSILQIPRPFHVLEITPLFELTGYAFPSGHATFFSAIAVAVFLFHRKLGVVYAGITLIIGLSRIIAGIHYPADICAGFILGGIIAYSIVRLFQHVNKEKGEKFD